MAAKKQTQQPPRVAPQKTTTAPNAAPSKTFSKWLPFVLGIVLVLVVMVTYSNGYQHEFVDWDDYTYIIDNYTIQNPTWEGLTQYWREPFFLNYHPLTMYSYGINSMLWGADKADSFIKVNVFFHVLNTLLVFAFAFLLSNRRWTVGFFTALFFAIHPMHVESVVWVSERKDVLYGFFFLLSLLTYLHYQQQKNIAWLALCWGLFVLSCLSKAMAVVLPVVLLAIDYYQKRPLNNPRVWLEKIPFFAVALFFGLMAMSIQSGSSFGGIFTPAGEHEKAVADFGIFSLLHRLIFSAYNWVIYLVKLFVPTNLCAFYPYPTLNPATDGLSMDYYIVPFLLIPVALIGVWAHRRAPYITFALLFYTITIALVLQFISVGGVIRADRYSYLPYIGLFFGIFMGIEQLVKQQKALQKPIWALMSILGVVGMWLSMQQVDTWKNTETLFNRVISIYPTQDRPYATIGNYLGKKGRIDEALQYMEKAVELGSKRGDLYEGLGNAYGSKQQFDKALSYFNKGIEFEPTKWGLYYNRAITYLMLNRSAEAFPDFEKTLELAPHKKQDVLFNRGRAYINTQKYTEALRDLDELLALLPQPNAEAYYLRGIAKHGLNDKQGAIDDYRKALQLNPQLTDAVTKLTALGATP